MLHEFVGFVLGVALVGAFLAFVPRVSDFVSSSAHGRRRPRR